ncbi:hypothetical protein GGR57DRAFT_156312 [Xylariaceae sp. FL1272]|nr:hypothetical protein GGR57DRAFT_156312 [Xylariaceae sp. FL1272]
MDDPSRILAQARQHLEALKQAGLSRDDLLALIGEDPQLQEQTPQQQKHVTADATALQNFNYHEINPSFKPPHQYRSSISTISSTSSRDSVFSTNSIRSSISSTTAPASEARFWCTSCNKTFKRKFDWKRHEEEFHDRSRKYPCDSCNQSFWGPNTFNQHHKSAHGCQTCPHAETVMRPMKKRRAYGCGFCAALHGQFERHIDHVAAHFESGMTKNDWSHSNVIYGLLHQHGIHEAWKSLISGKQNQFNEHQPMFGWSADSTGRAHGYVEGENPGQLQDLLEFYDGSKESAKKIVELADACVLVVLRPRSPSESPRATVLESTRTPPPTAPSSGNGAMQRQPSKPQTVREPRRAASTSAIGKGKTSRRTASSATAPVLATSANNHQSQPPVPSPSTLFSNYIPTNTHQPQPALSRQSQVPMSIQTHNTTYADKALPPPPLDPVSPMAVDFPPNPFGDDFKQPLSPPPHQHQQQHQQHNITTQHLPSQQIPNPHIPSQHIPPQPIPSQQPGFLSPLPEVDFMSDWQSFTSTLVDNGNGMDGLNRPHPMANGGLQHHDGMQVFDPRGFPMSWDDLGHYTPGP